MLLTSTSSFHQNMLYTLSRSVRLIFFSLMDENRYAWRGRRANYQVASATATLCESVGIREQAQWQFERRFDREIILVWDNRPLFYCSGIDAIFVKQRYCVRVLTRDACNNFT